MAMKITSQSGGCVNRKFDSLEELQEWAKKNVKNPATLAAIMEPIKQKPQPPIAFPTQETESKPEEEKVCV